MDSLKRHAPDARLDPPQSVQEEKWLFTVKPGGIAGYLASLCNTASYVNIKAKTDTFVGFLPADALERLLEKRPIVLLTLAKRLISMLSPLGKISNSHYLCSRLFAATSSSDRRFSRLATNRCWSCSMATK